MDTPENLLPKHTPEPRHSLGGKLKTLYVWRTPENELVLREVAREDNQVESVIKFNSEQWGYEESQMTPRTTAERVQFGEEASEKQLRVLKPKLLEDGSVVFPYLEEAETLSQFLKTAPQEEGKAKIEELFADVTKAHELGVVYGDRWPDNILVDPDRGIVHIDFDLKLGEFGKELELAQLILYTIALGIEENGEKESRFLETLYELLSGLKVPYETEKVRRYLFTKIRMAPHYNRLLPIAESLVRRLGWTS